MGSWSSLLLAKLWLKLIQQKRFLCNFVEVFHQTTAISEIFLRAIRIHNFQFSPLEYTLSKIVCSKWTENQIFLKTSFVKFYSVYPGMKRLWWNDSYCLHDFAEMKFHLGTNSFLTYVLLSKCLNIMKVWT